jgi:hypothetical protein
MKHEFCRYSFEKYSNVKIQENPSIGSRVLFVRIGGRAEKKHEEASNEQTEFEIATDIHVLCLFSFVIKFSAMFIVMDGITNFNIFRTVHLCIILEGDQLDAKFFYNTFISFNPLHVSSNSVLILRRPLTESDYTRSCIHTIALLRISA